MQEIIKDFLLFLAKVFDYFRQTKFQGSKRQKKIADFLKYKTKDWANGSLIRQRKRRGVNHKQKR